MPDYRTRPLDAGTWPDFARCAEAHNGIWGPDDVEGRSVSASFIHDGTVAMFEQQWFERTRRIGMPRSVVRKLVG